MTRQSLGFRVSLVAILCMLAGCGSAPPPAAPIAAPVQQPVPVQQPAPYQQPSPAQQPAPTSQPAPVQPQGSDKSKQSAQPVVRASEVKLVPLSLEHGVHLDMQVPEGWQVFAPLRGDAITISKGDIEVRGTIRLMKAAVPKSPSDVQTLEHLDTAAVVKQTTVPGATSAFEIRSTLSNDKQEYTEIALVAYGKTYRDRITMSAPSTVFAEWEPVFRQIMRSYKANGLDSGGLPSWPSIGG